MTSGSPSSPGRAPIAPVHPRVTLVRHRLGGRVLFAAAALTGRPTLAELAGGADVVWLPAPAPVAPGARYVLTRPRPLLGAPPARLQRATSAPGTRSPGRARWRATQRQSPRTPTRSPPSWRRLGVRGHVVSAGHHGAARRPRTPAAICSSSARTSRARRSACLTAAHVSAQARGPRRRAGRGRRRPAPGVDDAELARALRRRAGRRDALATWRASGSRRSRRPRTAPRPWSATCLLRRDAGRRGAARPRRRRRRARRCPAAHRPRRAPCARASAPPRATARPATPGSGRPAPCTRCSPRPRA